MNIRKLIIIKILYEAVKIDIKAIIYTVKSIFMYLEIVFII